MSSPVKQRTSARITLGRPCTPEDQPASSNTRSKMSGSKKRSASSTVPVKREALKRHKSNSSHEKSPSEDSVQCAPPPPSSLPEPFKTPSKATRHADVLSSQSSSNSTTPSAASQRSIYARARASLRLSYADESVPVLGREAQKQAVLDFLAPRFPSLFASQPSAREQGETKLGGGMYISGKPGSGKTVLVSHLTHDLPAAQGVLLNCTTLSNVWTHLLGVLEPGLKLQGAKARSKVQELLQLRDQPFLLILDEIDQLKPASDLDHLYKLADSSSLALVGIANTLTLSTALPESTVTLDFPPYDAAEMQAIAKQRLSSLPCSVVSQSALELASRKVVAGPADLRSFLAVLRRSIEQLETQLKKAAAAAAPPTPSEKGEQEEKAQEVSPKHVLQAIKAAGLSAAGSQPKSIVETALGNAGLMPRLALICICIALDRVAQPMPLQPSTSAAARTKAAKSSSPKLKPASPSSVSFEDAWTAYTDALRHAQHAEFIQSRTDWESLLDSLVVMGILNADLVTSPTSASKRPAPKRANSGSSTSGNKNRSGGAQVSLVHGLSATVEALMQGGEAAAVTRNIWEDEGRRRNRRARTWQASDEAPTAGFHGDGLDNKAPEAILGGKRKTDDHEDDLRWQ